ncbi:interferon-inducible GTPase-domain-containing protein [Trichophaea hybrida]|nr:interferon-inducible GTPase-domain-containing protein [Trichophaea hybrida]
MSLNAPIDKPKCVSFFAAFSTATSLVNRDTLQQALRNEAQKLEEAKEALRRERDALEEERQARKAAEKRESEEKHLREEAQQREQDERQAKEEAQRREQEQRQAREAAERERDRERQAREEAERRLGEKRQVREAAEKRGQEEKQAREEAERRRDGEREEAQRKQDVARRVREAPEKREQEEQRARREAEKREQARKEAERRQHQERQTREEAQRREEEERQARKEAETRQEECQAKEEAQRREQEARRREEEERLGREDTEKPEVEQRQSRGSGIVLNFIITLDDIAEARARLHYRENGRNIAVCGNAGSGKSSLINALRGFTNSNSRAVATGATETTLELACYTSVHGNTIYNWYDVPGAGTQKVSDRQYFQRQSLYIFDQLIVSYDIRFTELDAKILKNFQQYGPRNPETGGPPRAFIVRSKADQNINNIALDMGYDPDSNNRAVMAHIREAAQKQYIEETERDSRSNLERYGIPHQWVYIVSKDNIIKLLQGRRAPKEIDEGKLLRDLGLLPKR